MSDERSRWHGPSVVTALLVCLLPCGLLLVDPGPNLFSSPLFTNNKTTTNVQSSRPSSSPSPPSVPGPHLYHISITPEPHQNHTNPISDFRTSGHFLMASNGVPAPPILPSIEQARLMPDFPYSFRIRGYPEMVHGEDDAPERNIPQRILDFRVAFKFPPPQTLTIPWADDPYIIDGQPELPVPTRSYLSRGVQCEYPSAHPVWYHVPRLTLDCCLAIRPHASSCLVLSVRHHTVACCRYRHWPHHAAHPDGCPSPKNRRLG